MTKRRHVSQAWLDRANLIESSARDLLEQVDDALALPKRYLKRAHRYQLDLMADRLQVALNVEEPSLRTEMTDAGTTEAILTAVRLLRCARLVIETQRKYEMTSADTDEGFALMALSTLYQCHKIDFDYAINALIGE